MPHQSRYSLTPKTELIPDPHAPVFLIIEPCRWNHLVRHVSPDSYIIRHIWKIIQFKWKTRLITSILEILDIDGAMAKQEGLLLIKRRMRKRLIGKSATKLIKAKYPNHV